MCKLEIEGEITTFAVDTAVVLFAENINFLIKKTESGLKKICNWLGENRLKINVQKSKFIIFKSGSSRNNVFGLKIHSDQCINEETCTSQTIESTDTIHYLGNILDNKLKCVYHITGLCKKLNYINLKIFHLKSKINHDFLITLHYALVHSIVAFAIPFIGADYKTNLNKLSKIRKTDCYKT